MPAPDDLHRLLGSCKTQSPDGFDGLGVRFIAGKIEILRVEFTGILEEARIMALHIAEMLEQRLSERRRRKSAEAGEGVERVALARQALRLLVIDHLETMLDRPQEDIGGAEIGDGFDADPAIGLERVQHEQRLLAAQMRTPPAVNELLGLDEKLDLADAAAAELDVMAFDSDGLMALMGMDLSLHGMDIGDGGVVEIFPPDERPQIGKKVCADFEIAGDRARLDSAPHAPSSGRASRNS